MGESLQTKCTRRARALNGLLSATALGLFLEGCGGGGGEYWFFFGDNGTDQIEDSTFL